MGKYFRSLFESVLWLCWHSRTVHAPVRSFVGTIGVGVNMKGSLALVEDKLVHDWINVDSVKICSYATASGVCNTAANLFEPRKRAMERRNSTSVSQMAQPNNQKSWHICNATLSKASRTRRFRVFSIT